MRIWQALGDIYKSLEKYTSALNCYKRSLTAGNELVDPTILALIAKIYFTMSGHEKETANWFQLFVKDGRGAEKVFLFLFKF